MYTLNPNSELVQVNKCSSGDVNAALLSQSLSLGACARWHLKDPTSLAQARRSKVEASAGLI